MTIRSLFAATALIPLLMSVPAAAQQTTDADDDEKAAALFKQGSAHYGRGEYKQAISNLEKAFALRPAPPILLNIGRTYEKLNKPKEALKTYRRFLYKARFVDPSRALVAQLVARLEKKLGIKSARKGDLATPSANRSEARSRRAESRALQLIHTPVDNAKVHQPIIVQAELPPDLAVDGVRVHWRKGGQRHFRTIEMHKQGDGYIAEIPGRHVTSTSMQYFLVAYRAGAKKGGVVARTASRRTPNIIVIEGGVPPSLHPRNKNRTSPYRLAFWLSAGGTAALAAGATAFLILARDRSNAIETRAQQSCPDGVCVSPNFRFDAGNARDFESEGNAFSLAGGLLLGAGIAAAGFTGYLWYRDRRYSETRRREDSDDSASSKTDRQLSGSFVTLPWLGYGQAGVVGAFRF